MGNYKINFIMSMLFQTSKNILFKLGATK